METVVVGEVVGAHMEVAQPRVIGKRKGQRRRLVGLLSVLVDKMAHAGQMRGVGVERGGDGAFEGEGGRGR